MIGQQETSVETIVLNGTEYTRQGFEYIRQHVDGDNNEAHLEGHFIPGVSLLTDLEENKDRIASRSPSRQPLDNDGQPIFTRYAYHFPVTATIDAQKIKASHWLKQSGVENKVTIDPLINRQDSDMLSGQLFEVDSFPPSHNDDFFPPHSKAVRNVPQMIKEMQELGLNWTVTDEAKKVLGITD